MSMEGDTRVIVDQAREEMIYIGPDHPYYPLLARLVSAVGAAWQEGYDHHSVDGSNTNPYRWNIG
ncbi:hypothetical protein [Paenarthrobacter sp. PH39-S1]|uniref:hypothetical protein n=1 Tax=Paenarthrobacter sp. PH39-S1 TaxID=3046204 RepID=UPI0024B8C33E|nr:hypothetical protein [Paenarthrobacter sp. PH39-S1]MDJ0356291.1 hypothetical protein [Paenarthrobacter sp. PH39-S1]